MPVAPLEPLTINSVWQHRDGAKYEIIMFTNSLFPGKPKYPHTVVYQDIDSKDIFSRFVRDWYRSMTFIIQRDVPKNEFDVTSDKLEMVGKILLDVRDIYIEDNLRFTQENINLRDEVRSLKEILVKERSS